MGKYRRYKNRVEMFLASEKGKRALNIVYSWGASIVIIGALFKLLHLPYGSQILFVSMSVEALVFFISGFEHPSDEYHWEEVFPVLKSKNPMDRPDFAKHSDEAESHEGLGHIQMNTGGTSNISSGLHFNGVNLDVSEEDSKNLSASIKKLSGAAEQISKMGELTAVTEKYLEQLSGISENMERFNRVTSSLTEVSDTLLNSYKSITDNSDSVTQNTEGYVQQMDQLYHNIANMNKIYETQLANISSQMDAIQQISTGLGRIREMYDGSVVDSSIFRSETEKMTRQLTELNQIYTRLLQAMTVNVGYQPQQPNYQQQPQPNYQQPNYPPYGYQAQQTPYTNNPMK